MTAARKAYGTELWFLPRIRPERARGGGPEHSRLAIVMAVVAVAVAGTITVATAAGQGMRDLPLPIPSIAIESADSATGGPPSGPVQLATAVQPAASAPSSTSGATAPKTPSFKDRLRAAASRMAEEEVPPPPPAHPPTDEPAAAPVDPGAWRKPIRIPAGSPVPADRVEIRQAGDKVSLSVRELALNKLLMVLAQQLGVNIVCADSLTTPVSVTLERVSLEDAMTAICSAAGACWAVNNGIVHVSSISGTSKLPAEIQGRQVRVFRLDYIAAKDLETAIKPMLSPVGQAFVTETKTQDNRRTQDVLTVQDLPSYLRPIEQCVAELDRAPRQVLIEAHILAVDLNSQLTHGVDFKHLFAHLAQAQFAVQGFASAAAPQAFLFTFNGTHFDNIVEALRTQSAAKTLASPKVLVLNGQEARFQLGKQLGYRVRTATETSTMESVNFLDVGKVLKVTPRITADNRVLMHVKPEVSDGNVDPKTELPNSATTQVETDVMLPDGRGMVLGGLIDEKDEETQQKVPLLGDIWIVGRIFQRRTVTRERQEIIICLMPRIVPEDLPCDDRHESEVMRSQTPLVTDDLQRYPRPWEGVLPDAVDKPFRIKNSLPGSKPGRADNECRPLPYGCPVESIPYYGGGQAIQSAPLPPFRPDAAAPPSRQEPVRQTSYEAVVYPEPTPRR